MSRRVLILVNRHKPDVVGALPEIRSLIQAHASIVNELEADGVAISPEDVCEADLIVVLGGDGTLMGQSRRCVHLGLPMLGVNLGKLGFMAEFDLPALREQAKHLFDGSPLYVQDRPMLRVTLYPMREDQTILLGEHRTGTLNDESLLSRTLALNDAVVTAGPPYRMITLSIKIDGVQGPTVTGDGLIVSTPIGSTAYNASAGGAIISPDVPAMALTPLAAQSLAFRPVVIPLNSTIELTLERVNDEEDLPGLAGGTTLVLDGQAATRVHIGQKILIRQHARSVKFVRNQQGSYWTTLIRKMHWAAQPVVRAN